MYALGYKADKAHANDVTIIIEVRCRKLPTK
jgi:hypothetical protein